MPQQNQQEWGMRESTNLLYAVVNANATAITPFLRHSFGREALGFPGLFAFVLILIVAGFTGSRGMVIYLGVWVGAVAFQRLYTFRLISRGAVLHSKYEGWPAFAAIFTRGKVKEAVFLIEPFICVCAGGAFVSAGEAVIGHFFMFGAASLFIREAVHHTIDRRRLDALNDARIEQERVIGQYRDQGY